ncbi:MAG: Uma2 family endonuclease [Deltaproteobacteria bacterium]|nr:Uma2 family endonuclease [Deltaproteobacteria bacterium]
MGKTKHRATLDDLLRLPEHVVGEIIDGELFATPRPASPHARVASVLGVDLGGPFDKGSGGPGGWWILYEPELHFGHDVLVPDLAGWRRERMPKLPNVAAFELAPDWVCEVISPKTARLDRGRKMGVYARVGVKHMWIIDPLANLLEVYRLDGGRWSLLGTHEGNAVVRAEPFDAVEIDMSRWWIEISE